MCSNYVIAMESISSIERVLALLLSLRQANTSDSNMFVARNLSHAPSWSAQPTLYGGPLNQLVARPPSSFTAELQTE